MKERKKKILQGLGIGALACFGMVCLSGCSFIQISQQEYERLMDSVETVENTVDIVEATEYYNNAIIKNMDTSSNFWNNMKVQTTISYFDLDEEIIENRETYFFRTELEEQIYLTKTIGEIDNFENNSYKSLYTELGVLMSINKDGETYNKTQKNGYFVDSFLSGSLAEDFYLGIMVEDKFEFFKSADILKADINENSNYVVTTMLKDYDSSIGDIEVTSLVIDNEINEDANLVSQSITITTRKDGLTSTKKITNVYTYGTLKYEDIQTEFESLVNFDSQPEEE